MTAEAKQKKDWIEGYVDNLIDGHFVCSAAAFAKLDAQAEAAWQKHCEDGPSEIDNRDLGVWGLARCDGGIR